MILYHWVHQTLRRSPSAEWHRQGRCLHWDQGRCNMLQLMGHHWSWILMKIEAKNNKKWITANSRLHDFFDVMPAKWTCLCQVWRSSHGYERTMKVGSHGFVVFLGFLTFMYQEIYIDLPTCIRISRGFCHSSLPPKCCELQACKQSLKKLGVEYLDLYVIHWPGPKTGWPLKRGGWSEHRSSATPAVKSSFGSTSM